MADVSDKILMKYEIRTGWDAMGKIYQDVDFITNESRQAISRGVIDTQEAEVRKALIELGWTPPPERSTPHTSGEPL